jgi:hypothetical protein
LTIDAVLYNVSNTEDRHRSRPEFIDRLMADCPEKIQPLNEDLHDELTNFEMTRFNHALGDSAAPLMQHLDFVSFRNDSSTERDRKKSKYTNLIV